MRRASEGRVCLGEDQEDSGMVCAECGCSVCLLPAAGDDEPRAFIAPWRRPFLPVPLRTRYPFPQ